ncbi:PAS domain-containing protein, partial [bacterium]|nr:PAS domain-containing protein [bacterium]
RLLGYAAGEVVGTSAAQFFAPEDRAAGMFERELATAAAAGRAADDNWVVRKDGSRFWASGSTSAIPGPAHRPAGFVKVFRDRTEHRAANEAVRDARDRLRLALAAARMGIWSWHVPTNAQTRDANLNRLLGLPAEETAQPFDEFLTHIHPDDRAPVRAAFDASVRHDRPLNSEFRVVWSDGTVRWLRDQGDVFGAGGPDRHMAGVCVDITDLKAAEDALRQARDELEDRVRERTAELVAAEAGRRELLGRLVTGQEEERRRIARELHDSLGQYLTALGLGLATARDAAATPETRGRLDRLTELTAETGREVHRLATELRPTAIDDLGLRTSLQQHVEAWAARTGVTAEFAARGLDGERFPWQVSTAVYRVVQEALTNVARHARADRVSVLVERGADFLRAIVEDDGVGFDPDRTRADPRTGGLGLLGMRERVALVNGTLQIESSPDGGTTVFVRVPVPPQEPDDHE